MDEEDDGGGATASAGASSGLTEDLSLPKATVQKIIADNAPTDMAFTRESRDLLMECCVEFIQLLSTEANDIAEREAKKTIAGEHVVKALQDLGFPEFVGEVQALVQEHKEHLKTRERKQSKLEMSGLTEEELLRQQEELFGKARQKYELQQQHDEV